MPTQYVSAPKWLVCQCQYSIISAPRATNAHAACRHCPSYAGKLIDDPPIAPAFVSVIRKGACLEAYIRSAERNRLQTPEVVQACGVWLVLGRASASCMAAD